MEFRGVAGRAQMLHAPRKFRFKVARPQQAQQRAVRVGIGNHAGSGNFRTVFKAHARGPAILDDYLRDHGATANLGAGGPRGRRQGARDRAHAATWQREYARAPIPDTTVAVQRAVDGISRARAEPRPEDSIECQRSLEQRTLEGVFENVINIHGHDAQEFAHVSLPETPQVKREQRRRHRFAPRSKRQARRYASVLTCNKSGEFLHAGVVVRVCGAIGCRYASPLNLTVRYFERRPVTRQCERAQSHLRVAQSMTSQRQILFDRRIEQMQQVCNRGNLEARGKFARHRRTAYGLCGFKHQHLAPRAGQIGSAHETIVAGADDDNWRALSHRSTPWAPCRCDAGRAISRELHWRLARP